MIKSVELYFKGVIHTFETLFKGKFLIFFIPGLIAGALWGIYYWQTKAYRVAITESAEIPYIGGAVSWVFGSLGELVDFLVDQVFKFIILVCFSPFNTVLAEKYDNYITGNKFEGGFLKMLNDILRALFIVTMSFILELALLIVWWVLSFILPFDDVLSPIINFIIPAYFFGFSLYDYALERYGVGTLGSWGYSFKRMFTMILGGSLFVGILEIPYIGIILAPVIATMVTTYVYVHREGKLPTEEPVAAETE